MLSGHVFSEPPAGVTRFVSGPRERRVKPITVELEKLSEVVGDMEILP